MTFAKSTRSTRIISASVCMSTAFRPLPDVKRNTRECQGNVWDLKALASVLYTLPLLV